jgi:phosphoribosylformylglycinamidine cyclo-ligase
LSPDVVYSGDQLLTNTVEIPGNGPVSVGKLLLSPTRTYLPVMQALLREHRKKIHAFIHVTGGGQTKVLKFFKDALVVKDNLFPVPPLFSLIQKSSQTSWREMYQVFNMGHRMEIYLPARHADVVMQTAEQFGIEARIIGKVKRGQGEKVLVKSPHGKFEYA